MKITLGQLKDLIRETAMDSKKRPLPRLNTSGPNGFFKSGRAYVYDDGSHQFLMEPYVDEAESGFEVYVKGLDVPGTKRLGRVVKTGRGYDVAYVPQPQRSGPSGPGYHHDITTSLHHLLPGTETRDGGWSYDFSSIDWDSL